MTNLRTARTTGAKPSKPVAAKRKPAGTAKAVGAVPAATVAEVEASASAKAKQKLVRDSFTIPKAEYAVLDGLKLRAASLKRPTKKSELLRAGVAALHSMTDKAFLAVLNSVPSLKTGRPRGPRDGGKTAKPPAA